MTFLKFRLVKGRSLAGLAVSGLMIAVAGCQSGQSGSTAAQPKVLASELQAYCPRVTLREGTAYFNTYAKGGQDDPGKLVYQASISDVTRSCSRADGTMTLNVAAAGRVVPGPAGVPGSVNMPIRVAVVRGDELLYSKLHTVQVAMPDSSAAQFVFNDPNVTFPLPTEANVQVFVGYDEGPPAKKK